MADNIRVLLTEEEVNKRISEVAAQINKDYEGRPVHLICILKGGVFFTCPFPWISCPCPATDPAQSPAVL